MANRQVYLGGVLVTAQCTFKRTRYEVKMDGFTVSLRSRHIENSDGAIYSAIDTLHHLAHTFKGTGRDLIRKRLSPESSIEARKWAIQSLGVSDLETARRVSA